jgi:hypothetical protein
VVRRDGIGNGPAIDEKKYKGRFYLTIINSYIKVIDMKYRISFDLF